MDVCTTVWQPSSFPSVHAHPSAGFRDHTSLRHTRTTKEHHGHDSSVGTCPRHGSVRIPCQHAVSPPPFLPLLRPPPSYPARGRPKVSTRKSRLKMEREGRWRDGRGSGLGKTCVVAVSARNERNPKVRTLFFFLSAKSPSSSPGSDVKRRRSLHDARPTLGTASLVEGFANKGSYPDFVFPLLPTPILSRAGCLVSTRQHVAGRRHPPPPPPSPSIHHPTKVGKTVTRAPTLSHVYAG